MKGIEQARKFYTEVGIKMIADEFGDYQNRIAVGRVGHIRKQKLSKCLIIHRIYLFA